jgi:hypothetical protein
LFLVNAKITGCFSLRSKDAPRSIFRGEHVFEREKSMIFLFQKHARPDRFFQGRLLSEAKNSP